MLTVIRKSFNNWIIKIFLSIVILGFIITGSLFSYSNMKSSSNVASVDDINISADDFYNHFIYRINKELNHSNKELYPLMLRYFSKIILDEFINRAVLENTTNIINMAIDNKIILKKIMTNKIFQDDNGKFNKIIFNKILKKNNLFEKSYISLIKKQQIINQLINGLVTLKTSPKIFTNILNEYINEKRIVKFFHIKNSDIHMTDTISNDVLIEYYKTVIKKFATPEYRKIELLSLNPIKLAKTISISTARIKEIYESSKNSYNTVEKREISQIIYPNMKLAQKDYKRILKGITFLELSKEQNNNINTVLGIFSKDELPVKKMAKIAFNLKLNNVSKPIDLGVGIVLIKVSKIIPATFKTFEDVNQLISDTESLKLATNKINELRNDIEDELASGTSFKEISNIFPVSLKSIDSINSNLYSMNNIKVNIPYVNNLIQLFFKSKINIDNGPFDTLQGGLIWFKINKITKSYNRELKNIKDKVIDLWRTTEIDKLLLLKAKKIININNINSLLDKNNYIKSLKTLKRNDVSEDFSNEALKVLFSIKKGEITYALNNINGKKTYIIMELIKIIPPDKQNNLIFNTQIGKMIAQDLSTTLIESYIENNKQLYNIIVNQSLIDSMINNQSKKLLN